MAIGSLTFFSVRGLPRQSVRELSGRIRHHHDRFLKLAAHAHAADGRHSALLIKELWSEMAPSPSSPSSHTSQDVYGVQVYAINPISGASSNRTESGERCLPAVLTRPYS